MIKFNKKIYYKYFDLWRVSSFLDDKVAKERALHNMQLIKGQDKKDLSKYNTSQLQALGFNEKSSFEIYQYKSIREIPEISNYLNEMEDWLKMIVLPDFFDIEYLRSIFIDNSIKSKEDLLSYFKSSSCKQRIGSEKSELYAHFVLFSGGFNFPYEYAIHYSQKDEILKQFDQLKIRGNFHNHTTFSDGKCSIQQIVEMAQHSEREYVGISDHTERLYGISEADVISQHSIINDLNANNTLKILKSAECEVLTDGTLDLSVESLKRMDYVIAAIHYCTNQIKKDAEKRMIKAIENPFTNILAHPSARLYKKKVELFVDMKKIIDACVANNVVIEINGDPERLDLDPSYIDYAINKGAYFSLDSDTHSIEGFWNINNAIKIALDNHIPAERCINTFPLKQVLHFFQKQSK